MGGINIWRMKPFLQVELLTKTPENIMLGAGTIHKGLKYEGSKWNFVESLFCATSGGGSVSFFS